MGWNGKRNGSPAWNTFVLTHGLACSPEQLKIDPMITGEMKKDLHRLERITDRFSKIGSESKLEDSDIIQTIEQNLIYLKARLSKK